MTKKEEETKKSAGTKNPMSLNKSMEDANDDAAMKGVVDFLSCEALDEAALERWMALGAHASDATFQVRRLLAVRKLEEDSAEAPAAKRLLWITGEENSGSASTSMADSSSTIPNSSDDQLTTFVKSRLGAINSPTVAKRVWGVQRMSGFENVTLGDLINHNMRLAHDHYQVKEETILATALVSLLPESEVEASSEISSEVKAAHREVVLYRDLLLFLKVPHNFPRTYIGTEPRLSRYGPRIVVKQEETISEALLTEWKLAAPSLSDTAQVALMVNLLGTAMKLTGLKPVDFVPQEVPGGKMVMVSYWREEMEVYLAIFNSVADAMAKGWKEGETNLPVKRRMLADLSAIIQNFIHQL